MNRNLQLIQNFVLTHTLCRKNYSPQERKPLECITNAGNKHNTGKNTNKEFVCSDCGIKYRHYSSLYKHRKRVHPDMQVKGSIACNEEGCSFTCYYTAQLREHLTNTHLMDIESESLTFKSQ